MPELLFDERAEPGVLLKELSQLGDGRGVLAAQVRKLFQDVEILCGISFGRFGGDGLPTPDTPALVAGGLLVAARTDQWREVLLSAAVGNLKSHQASVFVTDILVKDGDVARDRVGPGRAALALLDVPGVHALLGEPGKVTLPQRRRRDRPVDAGPASRLLEHIEEVLVGELRGFVEVTPERVAVSSRVVGQPAIDVRRRWDEVDRALAGLPVNAHGQSVLRVRDIADRQLVEFAAAEASIKLQGNSSGVAAVLCAVEHCLDVGVPDEHLGGVRTGVVIVRECRGDPVDAGRRLTRVTTDAAVGRASAEHTECDAVVLVCLGRLVEVILGVNPADNLLGGVAVFERVDEVDIGFFRHSDTVPEQLLVAVVAVHLPHQVHLVAEREQDFTVAVGPAALAVLEFRPQRLNGLFRVGHTVPFIRWLLNIRFKSHPWLSSFCLHANAESINGSGARTVESHSVTPHNAIATAGGGA